MLRRFGEIMPPLSRNKNASSKGVKYNLNNSLRSKRFGLVSEQRKTEERYSRF